MSVSATIKASVQGQQSNALDMGTVSFPFALAANSSYSDGTGAGQVDVMFTDQRTLAASGTEDLDLAGSLSDALGATLTMAKLKFVMVKAASGNTNDVVLSRPASNGVPLFTAAGDSIAIKPGGVFIWAVPGTGVAVTAGTGDLLTFTNSAAGTGVTYDVVLLGTSA
jgi:hypothetical protein